jgi:hypothetical protein
VLSGHHRLPGLRGVVWHETVMCFSGFPGGVSSNDVVRRKAELFLLGQADEAGSVGWCGRKRSGVGVLRARLMVQAQRVGWVGGCTVFGGRHGMHRLTGLGGVEGCSLFGGPRE